MTLGTFQAVKFGGSRGGPRVGRLAPSTIPKCDAKDRWWSILRESHIGETALSRGFGRSEGNSISSYPLQLKIVPVLRNVVAYIVIGRDDGAHSAPPVVVGDDNLHDVIV